MPDNVQRGGVGIGIGETIYSPSPPMASSFPTSDPSPRADRTVTMGPVQFDTATAPMIFGHPLDSPDFALRWPRDLFVQEAAVVIQMEADHQRHLLEEAFGDPLPVECFDQASRDGRGVEVLAALVEHVDIFRSHRPYRPYFQQRLREQERDPDDWEPDGRDLLPMFFVQLVADLDRRGYFVRAFGADCMDNGPSEISAPGVVGQYLGWNPAWPLDANELNDDGKLYDVIERLDDLVARPRRRFAHLSGECVHYVEPAPAFGRAVYRWQVNELLDDAGVGLRLADDGDDAGRLVTVTDEARTGLMQTMTGRTDASTGDRVRHAISLFRSRGATEDHKRSACTALALVLEERRTLLKEELIQKDEGALFHIANEFAIRHEDGKQQGDYRPGFRDWIFWWYLATIELTDRLLSDQSGTTET